MDILEEFNKLSVSEQQKIALEIMKLLPPWEQRDIFNELN